MVNFGMSQVSGRIKNLNEKEKKNNYSETLTSSGNS